MTNHRIGRPFGIELGVHGSLLAFLGFFVLVELVSTGLGGAFGTVLLAVLLFGSVALHELGHALAARAYGIGTRAITLLPIGGIAMLERDIRKPRQELVIALAGPLVNVVIAAGITLIERMLGGVLVHVPLLMVLLEQALWINMVLALFNLLPAFPMDGGRVLRAFLSARVGRLRATRIAGRIGLALAIGLGVLGLFQGSMLLFIAIFVWYAAKAEIRQVEAEEWVGSQPDMAFGGGSPGGVFFHGSSPGGGFSGQRIHIRTPKWVRDLY
jgi:Zn-dependent protease